MSVVPTENIEIVRGDGEKYTITVTQEGVAVDISDAQIWYTAKTSYTHTDEQAVIRKAVDGIDSELTGITITNGPGGIAELELLGEDTDDIGTASTRPTVLYHDAQIQLPGEEPHTIFRGKLTVLPDVTRSTN